MFTDKHTPYFRQFFFISSRHYMDMPKLEKWPNCGVQLIGAQPWMRIHIIESPRHIGDVCVVSIYAQQVRIMHACTVLNDSCADARVILVEGSSQYLAGVGSKEGKLGHIDSNKECNLFWSPFLGARRILISHLIKAPSLKPSFCYS